ncbi:Ig-like domain-containing protein, partial [Psychrobacter faecalis]
MNTITIKVNDQIKTIAEHKVVTRDGQPTVIKASSKVNYELLDEATGRAPKHIITKRINKDLHVSFEDDSENPDLIIEGFYDEVDSALIGLAEDGSYYYYIPDTGEIVDYVTELQIGDIEGQALGGKSQATPWWIGATEGESFNALPWLAGLAGIGILGAALGSSSSSDNRPPIDTTAPAAPVVAINENGSAVTVSGEKGAAVAITTPTGVIYGKIGADGSFTATLEPALTNGEEVSATLTDAAGNTSQPGTDSAADTTAPTTPSISLVTDSGSDATDGITNDGTLAIDAKGDTVQSVVATTATGTEMTIEANEDGDYVLPEGVYTKVTVTTVDAAGNTNTAETGAITVDTTAPDAPSIGLETDSGINTTDGITNDGTLDIDPQGETIQSVVATTATGTVTIEANEDGDYVLPEGVYTKVTVTTVDAAGNTNTAETGAITVDTTAPDAPSIGLVTDSGTDATDGITNDGTLAIDAKGET